MMENRVQQVKKMFNDGIIINLEKENIVEIDVIIVMIRVVT